MDPIPYEGSRADARSRLIRLLEEDRRATIREQRDDYLHVEFRAMVFIDDVEFHLPKDESVIRFRSASRLGYSDLGANRRRMRGLAAAFTSRG